jgi:hypothetical protein
MQRVHYPMARFIAQSPVWCQLDLLGEWPHCQKSPTCGEVSLTLRDDRRPSVCPLSCEGTGPELRLRCLPARRRKRET